MKKRIAVAGAAIFGALAPGMTFAAGHDAPGTPGAKNCHGQTMAYLNQAAKELGINGIGNLADTAGLTVQEVQDVVAAYCAAP